MTVLFELLLPKGHGKPVVRSVPGVISGVYDEVTRTNRAPDGAAVREALPHYWRAAFDRARGVFWFIKDARIDAAGVVTDGTCYVSLFTTRRRLLVTLYARPYRFVPQGAQQC